MILSNLTHGRLNITASKASTSTRVLAASAERLFFFLLRPSGLSSSLEEPPLVFWESLRPRAVCSFQIETTCKENAYGTVQYSTVRYGTVRYDTVRILMLSKWIHSVPIS